MTRLIIRLFLLLFFYSIVFLSSASAFTDELFEYGTVKKNKGEFQYILEKDSGVYLSQTVNNEKKCLHLKGPGEFTTKRIEKLYQQKDTTLEQLSCQFGAIAKNLEKPIVLILSPTMKGDKSPSELTSYQQKQAEKIWEKMVLNKPLSPKELLAAAIWYQNNNLNVRAAALLDKRLEDQNSKGHQTIKEWRRNLGVIPFEIDSEINSTRSKLSSIAYYPKKNIALLIGVSDYESWSRLVSPLNDIERLEKILVEQYHFQKDRITVLKNPNRIELWNQIEDLKNKVNDNDNLIIYYAGHGKSQNGRHYWIPVDGKDKGYSWYDTREIIESVKRLKSRHTLLLADSCFSGGLVTGFKSQSEGELALYRQKSFQVISSSSDKEKADDADETGYSPFAQALFEKLERQKGDQPLLAMDLSNHLKKKLSGNQKPQLGYYDQNGFGQGEFFFSKQPQLFVLNTANLSSNDAYTQDNNVILIESPKAKETEPDIYESNYVHQIQLLFKQLSLSRYDEETEYVNGWGGSYNFIWLSPQTPKWFPFSLNHWFGKASIEAGEYYSHEWNNNKDSINGNFYGIGASVGYKFFHKHPWNLDLSGGFQYEKHHLNTYKEQGSVSAQSLYFILNPIAHKSKFFEWNIPWSVGLNMGFQIGKPSGSLFNDKDIKNTNFFDFDLAIYF